MELQSLINSMRVELDASRSKIDYLSQTNASSNNQLVTTTYY